MPMGPAPTIATVSPGRTWPASTDLEAGGQDVAEHHQRFGVYVLRCRIQTVVGMWYTDVLGLGAVDLMAENPAAIRAMCVKLLLAVFTATT